MTRVRRVPKQKTSTRRPAAIAANPNWRRAREYGAIEPLMSRISTRGRERVRRARYARSNGSPCVRSDRRSVRRMSNVAPFGAGRVRRVRSIGTFTVRSRIIRATRWRSSSLSSANDFDRSTSTAEATMRIDASSPGSGSSSSPAPRHDAAVCPTVISRPSGSSVRLRRRDRQLELDHEFRRHRRASGTTRRTPRRRSRCRRGSRRASPGRPSTATRDRSGRGRRPRGRT